MPNANDQFELFFTIAKFEGNMGYSLTQNYDAATTPPSDALHAVDETAGMVVDD